MKGAAMHHVPGEQQATFPLCFAWMFEGPWSLHFLGHKQVDFLFFPFPLFSDSEQILK